MSIKGIRHVKINYMVTVVFFSLLFLVPAAIEGMGITQYNQFFIWYYILVPAFLCLYSIFTSTHLKIPPKITLVALLFFVFASVSSSLYSLDKQVSVEYFLFLISLFLIFLFSFSHKTMVRRVMIPGIIGLGILFTLYSLFVHTAPHEKQVIASFYGSHNHLGDYLGLVLITLLLLHIKGLLRLAGLFFTFIFMVFSYSRSAYLSLIIAIVFILMGKYRSIGRRYLLVGFIALCTLLVVFAIASSQRLTRDSFLYPVQNIAIQYFQLLPRDILAGRDIFFNQAYQSIIANPLFGVGGGNFIKVSLRFNKNNNFTDSAHNILLEIAAEQGVPAFLVFLMFGTILAVNALRKKDISSYVLLYLICNFQTDYTYKIYFFLVFSAILAGISYEEKVPAHIPLWTYGLTSIFLLGIFICYLTSSILLNFGAPLDAIRWYPLNKWAYIHAIRQEKIIESSDLLTKTALKISPDDSGVMLTSAQSRHKMGDLRGALQVYEQMYEDNHLVNFSVIRDLYSLKKELISKEEADKFLVEVAINYREIEFVPDYSMREFAEFCIKNRGKLCNETAWDYKKVGYK